MDSKIQELTEKIYREGVEKGNEEAGRIVADAKEKEVSMLREARTGELAPITAEIIDDGAGDL
mgnify:CR=1 FL=1